jgi:membrane protease YdiL (CAAX protease family)
MMVAPVLVAAAVDQSGLLGRVYGRDQPVDAAVRGLWVGLIAAPVQLGLLFAGYRYHVRPRPAPTRRSPAAAVATGVGWWLVLTPPVLLVHGGVNLVFELLGFAAEEHPLTRLGADRPAADRLMFVIQAGVVAPLLEEILFRGVLLGWLVAGNQRPSEQRVWTMLIVTLFVAPVTRPENPWSPVLFAALLTGGWALLRTRVRKRRTLGGVYASAALFAAIHSSVWPTPIPLFVLGLGLGWVAVRTNSVLAPAVVHGLFNTVSVLFVLGGGAK